METFDAIIELKPPVGGIHLRPADRLSAFFRQLMRNNPGLCVYMETEPPYDGETDIFSLDTHPQVLDLYAADSPIRVFLIGGNDDATTIVFLLRGPQGNIDNIALTAREEIERMFLEWPTKSSLDADWEP